MNEPPSLPDYPVDGIIPARYYCFDCVHQTVSDQEMKNHHKQAHGTDAPLKDLDFGLGDRIAWMRKARLEWIELQSLSFGLEMHEGFGAEDFLAEAEIRSA